jgi:cytochrome c556
MPMTRPMMTVLLGSALALTSIAPALAGPDEAIQFRKGIMEGVGAGVLGVSATLKGDLDQQANLKDITQMLAINARLAKSAFRTNTAGQGKERTTSKDTIWSNWDDYAKKMDAFSLAAANLARVTARDAKNQKAIGEAFRAVVGTCKGCHDDYRQK